MFTINTKLVTLFSHSARIAMRAIAVLILVVVSLGVYTYTRTGTQGTADAAVGINRQINFQGKLVNPNGTNVTDGSYTIVFSIYTVASGGTAVWTETQTPTLSNGIFQVNLGSVTALPGSIDFNTDNIYLGIKVGADAEMAPRVQFTAVAQAFNSEKLGGLDKTGFIQNTTTQQAASNFNISGAGVIGTSLTTPTLQSGAGVALTITANAASTWSTTAGNLTLQTGGTGNIVLNSAGVIDLQDNLQNSVGDLVLNDQVQLGGTTGLQITTAGVITDLDGASVVIGENLSVTAGGASIVGNSTIATTAGNTLGLGNSTGAVTVTGSSASTFVLNGVTVDTTEFNRLDGKDAALVDTNDAVATAITGTGALSAGSIASGFGTISTSNTITGTTINGTTGINTGAGAGTQRIDASGNLVNIGNITSSGTLTTTAVNARGYATSNTSSTNSGQWTRLASCTLVAQYQDCRLQTTIVSTADGGSIDRAMVDVRVKQQNAMAGVPYVAVELYDSVGITTSDISAVTTVNDASSTVVEVWGRINATFRVWNVSPIINSGSFQFSMLTNQGFSVSLPAGAVATTSYASLTVNNLTAGGNLSVTGTYNTNTFNGSTLTFGTAGAATIQAASNQNLTLQTQGTGILTLDSGTTGAVNIATNANAKTITIGNATGATAVTLNTGTGGLNLGNNGVNKTINIGVTGSTANTTTVNVATSTGAAQTIFIGGTATSGTTSNSGTVVSLQGGATILSVGNAGGSIRTFTNSTTAFTVSDSAGTALVAANTTNRSVSVNQGNLYVTNFGTPGTPTAAVGSNQGGTFSGAATTTYYYKVTALNAAGESLASGQSTGFASTSFTPLTAPTAPTVAVNATAGNLNGTYTYKITFTTANGETTGGTTSAAISPVSQQVDLTAIPLGPTGTTSRKIYRTVAGGADGTQRLVTTLADNTTTTYLDNVADGSLGAVLPGSNTARTNTNNLTVTYTNVTGATSYRLYRYTTSGAASGNYQTDTDGTPFTDTGAAGTVATIPLTSTSGSVGIGTSTATASLDVRGNALFKNAGNTTTAFQIQSSASATSIFNVDTVNERIGIGTNAPSARLEVANAGGATAGLLVSAASVPTVDMVSITNAGQAITTAGVNLFSLNYVGGAAAVEAAAGRIDLQPGGTTGGTWSGWRMVHNATGPATGVTSNGDKFEGPTTGGAGTYNAINIANIGAVTTGGVVRGINITGTNSQAAGTVRGIQINSITPGAASEIAIDLGTGWDNLLTYNNGATTLINGSGQWNLAQVTGTLGAANGGTGLNTSASTGVATVSAGTWSIAASLGIALGGTGATTSQAAINNLSQLTTEGDLLFRNATNSTRLARGTNGQCLTSNATTLVWSSCGLAAEADTLASVTGRGATTTTASSFTGGATIRGLTVDTATATDDIILMSVTAGGAGRFNGTVTNADLTAARTYTLPDASGTFAISASNNIALSAAGNISFTGTLPIANGGTNSTSFTTNGVNYFNGTSIVSSAAGTSAQVLQANGSGVPTFVTFSGDVTIAAGGTVTIANNAVTSAKIADNQIVDADLATGTFAKITGTGALNTGSIASGFGTISTGNNITTTTSVQGATVNATTGYQINGAAASGSYLRGNGTNFVASTIQAADLPTGSANYIQNTTTQQASSNFNISGAGVIGTTLVVTGASSLNGGATIRGVTVDSATATQDRILTTIAAVGAARFDGTITNADLTAARTYTLPDATGTFITTGNLTSITTTGTITAGTWQGTAIGAAYGGTGINTSGSTGVATVSAGTWSVVASLSDAQVSDTLTSSLFVGSGSTTTSVDLGSAEVAGTLGVANGGTGATTSQAAINNLSQLTTEGDLLFRNATNSTRLARGTNGQCLTSNATTILWGTCAAGIANVGTYSTTNTAANGATITGSDIIFQNASASAPGMVGTGAQTFGGNKTFNGTLGIGVTASSPKLYVAGTVAAGDSIVRVDGSITTAGTNQIGFNLQPSFTPATTFSTVGLYLKPSITVGAGFTSPVYKGISVDAPTKNITGTVTDAFGIFIENLGNVATNNFSLYVAGSTSASVIDGALSVGSSSVPNGTAAPSVQLNVDTDPGDNRVALRVDQEDTTNNNAAFVLTNAGTGNSIQVDTSEFVLSSTGAATFQNSTNSVNAFRVLTAGGSPVTSLIVDTLNNRVGINSASPGAQLDVNASGDIVARLNSTGAANDLLQLTKSGTAVATFSNAGNLGIGTGADANIKLKASRSGTGTEAIVAQFDVAGAGAQNPAIALSSNNTIGLKLTQKDSFTNAFIDNNFASATNLSFGLRGSEVARFDNNGNFAIGSTTTASKLSVGGTLTGNSDAFYLNTIVDNGGDAVGISLEPTLDAGNGGSAYGYYTNPTLVSTTGQTLANYYGSFFGAAAKSGAGTGPITNAYQLYISETNVATTNYGLYVDGTNNNYIGGNLGVGSPNPRAKLDVQGMVFINQQFGLASDNAVIDLAIGDSDTGFDSQGDGILGIYIDNSQRGTMNFTDFTFQGTINAGNEFQAGEFDVSDPADAAFTFFNDGDTGMYSSILDNLGFSTSGVGRLDINQAGFIGIGSGAGAQQALLDVASSFTGQSAALRVRTSITGNAAPSSNNNLIAFDLQPTLNPTNGNGADAQYIMATITADAGETVSFYRGIDINAPTKLGTGTITTAYQLFVTPTTIGTTNYSLYVAGGDSVFNNGKVGIGNSTTGSNVKLHVDTDPGENQVALRIDQEDTTNNNRAVEITNSGTGASFFIGDDGTTTDTTPFVVDASGSVGIGTALPTNVLSVSPLQYSTGTASQSGATITGSGTAFTAAMVGSEIIFANGSKATITAWTNATTLTATPSQTVASQSYHIHYAGLQVTNAGFVGIGTAAPTALLNVKVTNDPYAEVTAPELFSAFAASAGWAVSGSGRNATATHTNGGGTTNLTASPNITGIANESFIVEYTVSGRTTGCVSHTLGGWGTGCNTGNTVFRSVYPTTNTTSMVFTPSTDFDGTISNVSIRRVTGGSTAASFVVSPYASGSALELRIGAGNNVFLGSSAGARNIGPGGNIALGTSALAGNVGGNSNVAIGNSTLQASTGSSNIAIGSSALSLTTTGTSNVAIGPGAGQSNTTGSNNVYIGQNAGLNDGTNHTLNNIQNASAIGFYAQVQQSNALVLGGIASSQVNVGIGTTMPTNVLSVSPLQYNTGTAGTGGVSSNTVTGAGTTFTASMVGSEIVFANGNSSTTPQKATITGFTSATSITVSPAITVAAGTAYRIHYAGLQVTNGGNVGIGTTTAGNRLQVSTIIGNDGLAVTGANSLATGLLMNLGTGSFNPLVQANDRGIIFSGPSVNNAGNFVIAPWNNTKGGIHISSAGLVGVGTRASSNTITVGAIGDALGSGAIRATPSDEATSGGYIIMSQMSAAGGSYGYLQSGDSGAYRNISLNPFGGNVGIGSTNPGAQLETYKATTTQIDLLRVISDVGVVGNIKFRVDSFGNVYADGGYYGASYNAGSADLAENYLNNDGAEAGDVVFFTDNRTVAKSTGAGQEGLAGIVSTQPGVTLASYVSGVPVALSGRVPAKVTVANGQIKKGDYLTSAPDGKAQKATTAGPTIGIAMEDATEDGIVDVFVSLGAYNPYDGNNIQAQSGAFGTLSITGDTTVSGNLNVSGASTLANLTVTGDAEIRGNLKVIGNIEAANIIVNGKIIAKGAIPQVTVGVAGGTSVLAEQAPIATVSGNDTAGTVTVKTGQTIAEDGVLAEITFAQAFSGDFKVALTATNINAIDIKVYVEKTATGFRLVTKDMPVSLTEYNFDYIVIGAEN